MVFVSIQKVDVIRMYLLSQDQIMINHRIYSHSIQFLTYGHLYIIKTILQ